MHAWLIMYLLQFKFSYYLTQYDKFDTYMSLWVSYFCIKAGDHESYVLSQMSFVTIGLSQLALCEGNLSSDIGHSWHVSKRSNQFW